MSKQPAKEVPSASAKLQLKQSLLKAYHFGMFMGAAIGAYVLWFNGNSTSLSVVALVLGVDAAIHVYKLVAVIE